MKRPRTLLGLATAVALAGAAFATTGHAAAGVVLGALAIAIISTTVSILHRKDPRA